MAAPSPPASRRSSTWIDPVCLSTVPNESETAVTYFEAVLLGVIQGVFMFFPVSSTSHLALAQHWLISDGSLIAAPESPEMILFDLAVHVGTLFSIAWVFAPGLTLYFRKLWGELPALPAALTSRRIPLYTRLTLLGVVTVGVTGVLGLLFRDAFGHIFANPQAIAVCLALTGLLLYATDWLRPVRVGLRQLGPGIAILIGVAQFLSLAPGLSRSGLTIVFALFAGVKRRWAATYSFLIAIPTILAASAVHLVSVLRQAEPAQVDWLPMLVATAVAAVTGIFALKIVLSLLYRARFRIFAFYLWMFAAVVLYTGVGT